MHARAPRVSQRAAALSLVGLCVASVAIVAALLVPSPSPGLPAQPWAVAGTLVVANLPVARCPTSYGIPSARDVDLPRFVRAVLSRALAPTVSVFTDGLGTLDVVAPTAWGCTALDGVAGSSTLIVYPPGEQRPSWGHVTAVRSGIVATQTGGCAGCSIETACPLFAAAAHQYAVIYRSSCRHAAEERRTDVSGSTVLFVDPPGVLGSGEPSGGALAAYGAMLWHLPGARHPTAWRVTCTLPSADQPLCVLSVRAFLARHGVAAPSGAVA
ncbi:MAG TPA: hypothetical protein VGZ03_10580 [Acidimicrobiales bacterium]|jgi:hypothetical protein|nr:hypothetical protein [Acidimicrobiales bacterium]